jgi:hypothetical protein
MLSYMGLAPPAGAAVANDDAVEEEDSEERSGVPAGAPSA